jgi:hypothetical protein
MMERIRCWFSPMRPVTPFMITPRRCDVIWNAPCGVLAFGLFERRQLHEN